MKAISFKDFDTEGGNTNLFMGSFLNIETEHLIDAILRELKKKDLVIDEFVKLENLTWYYNFPVIGKSSAYKNAVEENIIEISKDKLKVRIGEEGIKKLKEKFLRS